MSEAGEESRKGRSTVLIVEDEPGLRQGLVDVVRAMGFAAIAAAGLVEARRALADDAPDCVLLDIRLRDGDGLEFLTELRSRESATGTPIPVIVATAYGDSERTIRAMRDGAFDYLTKPFDLAVLRATVARAIRQRAIVQVAEADAARVLPAPAGRRDLIGTSAAMLAVWKLIGRAAASRAPVLITGETGTGKELVARAIHAYSDRTGTPFVALNLPAIPPTLIESELFGHERGAFTGAVGRRSGRIEVAGDGTLFLDEIGELDQALQTKLLRVVQEGTFERVGGNDVLVSKARLIAATNRPVRPGEAGAALREDLYYRLAVIEIEVPPLRVRRSDIPLLIAHALHGTTARAISEEAMQRLVAYDWPGNVRELTHVIERAAVLCGGEVIDLANLPASVLAEIAASGDADLSLYPALARLEREIIAKALARANGNRSAAARLLGIGRAQLYAKLDEHSLTDRGAVDPED